MANTKTISSPIDEAVTLSVVKDLEAFSRSALLLREKLLRLVPASKGSDAWWKKSVEKSKSDIAKGRYEKFSSMEDAVAYLERI